MQSILIEMSQWVRPYLNSISMAIIATLLVIYGDIINKQIRNQLRSLHFILRAIFFTAICAFGYGAFIVFLTPALNHAFLNLPYQWLGVSVIGVFLVIGILAERRNYI